MGLENTIQGFALKAMEGVITTIPKNMEKLGGNLKAPPFKGGLVGLPPLSSNPKVNALLTGITNKIPSPDILKKRICDAPTAEGASLNYNSLKKGMEKSKKLLAQLMKQIDKLSNLISKIKSALETITTILDLLDIAIGVAKALIIGMEVALAALTIPHISGFVTDKLGNIKTKTKIKIEKYLLVITGINILVKIIIPLLDKFDKQLAGVNGAYDGVTSALGLSEGMMDDCLRENLVTQIDSSELTEGVALDGLVDIYNSSGITYNSSGIRLIKIREYETNPSSETKEYNVKTIPSEEFKN